ncbi:MAG: hypothetical protein K0U36_03300 [Alphaproteobacteria bacterium]|nr:hypothetical protein [Alphaproteobacteria bacterium]
MSLDTSADYSATITDDGATFFVNFNPTTNVVSGSALQYPGIYNVVINSATTSLRAVVTLSGDLTAVATDLTTLTHTQDALDASTQGILLIPEVLFRDDDDFVLSAQTSSTEAALLAGLSFDATTNRFVVDEDALLPLTTEQGGVSVADHDVVVEVVATAAQADGSDQLATQTLTLTLNNAPTADADAVTALSTSLFTGVSTNYTLSSLFRDEDEDALTFAIEASDDAIDATYNAATTVASVNITAEGTYTLTITASDGFGTTTQLVTLSASSSFDLGTLDPIAASTTAAINLGAMGPSDTQAVYAATISDGAVSFSVDYDPATQEVSGNALRYAGIYTLSVKSANEAVLATVTLTGDLAAVDSADTTLSLEQTALDSSTQGILLTPEALFRDDDDFVLSAQTSGTESALLAGLSFDATTNRFVVDEGALQPLTGQQEGVAVPDHNVTVEVVATAAQADEAPDQLATQTLTLSLNNAPTANAAGLSALNTDLLVGAGFRFPVAPLVTDEDLDALSIIIAEDQAALISSLDNGFATVTPQTIGAYTLDVIASDGRAMFTQKIDFVALDTANFGALSPAAASMDAVVVLTDQYVFDASAVYAATISDGAAEFAVDFDKTTNMLSGAFMRYAGVYDLAVTSNALSLLATLTLTGDLAAVDSADTILSHAQTALDSSTQGIQLAPDVLFRDDDDIVLSAQTSSTESALLAGLSFDATTNRFVVDEALLQPLTAQQGGVAVPDHDVVVEVVATAAQADGAPDQLATQTLTLTLNNAPTVDADALTALTKELLSLTPHTFNANALFSDEDADALTLSIATQSAGFTPIYDAGTGMVTVQSSAVGVATLTLSAGDGTTTTTQEIEFVFQAGATKGKFGGAHLLLANDFADNELVIDLDDYFPEFSTATYTPPTLPNVSFDMSTNELRIGSEALPAAGDTEAFTIIATLGGEAHREGILLSRAVAAATPASVIAEGNVATFKGTDGDFSIRATASHLRDHNGDGIADVQYLTGDGARDDTKINGHQFIHYGGMGFTAQTYTASTGGVHDLLLNEDTDNVRLGIGGNFTTYRTDYLQLLSADLDNDGQLEHFISMKTYNGSNASAASRHFYVSASGMAESGKTTLSLDGDAVDDIGDGASDVAITHTLDESPGNIFPNPARNFSSTLTEGDINGDGFIDVFVGQYEVGPVTDFPLNNSLGRARVHFGRDYETPSTDPFFGVTFTSEKGGNLLPNPIGDATVLVDFNGDGLDDMVVAYGQYTHTVERTGAVVVYGTPTTGNTPTTIDLSTTADAPPIPMGSYDVHLAVAPVMDDTKEDSAFARVASAGDVNGDGYEDLIFREDNQAHAVLWFGGGVNGAAPVNASIENFRTDAESANDQKIIRFDSTNDFGDGTAGLLNLTGYVGSGDFNGDGYSDLVISGETNSNIRHDSSKIWIVYGRSDADWAAHETDWDYRYALSNTGLDADEGIFISATTGLPVLGNISLGDVNADGYDDLLVGRERLPAIPGKTDWVSLYFGGNTLGQPLSAEAEYGTAGNDTLTLDSPAFVRAAGGLGVDTVVLSNAFELDLTSTGFAGSGVEIDYGHRNRLRSIEAVDLDGTGGTLRLDPLSVYGMTERRAEFGSEVGKAAIVVLGGGEDSVHLEGGTWAKTSDAATITGSGVAAIDADMYDIYALENALVYISTAIADVSV